MPASVVAAESQTLPYLHDELQQLLAMPTAMLLNVHDD